METVFSHATPDSFTPGIVTSCVDVLISREAGWGAKRGPSPTRLATPSPNLLRSSICDPCASNTKEMPSLDLHDGRSDGNFMGRLGTILTRSWYMADDPPSYSDLDAQLDWFCLVLSEPNRIVAAGIHAAYDQGRSQITNGTSALEAFEQQYYKLKCDLTPTHRLPAEIIMEIFHIALDIGQLRTGLMLVCRRWCTIIEEMASLWASLDLGGGTTPESVQRLLSRAGTHPLLVKIDTKKERSTAGELHSSLAMAGNKASQWQTLKIISLSQGEADAEADHALPSIQLQPMRQLRHLYIKEPVLSPLLRLLLQNVATTTGGNLVSMEIHSLSAIQYLVQPAHVSVYCHLTTFIAKVPKMSHMIGLLSHFKQVEVLDLTNLQLSILDNGSPLPLAHTLRHLRLKTVSIQWMGGQVFSQLEDCAIVAPLNDPSLHHDVQLPACTKLHFENWDISPIGHFFAPELDHMRVKSNAWSPYTGNGQVVQLVRTGLGMELQPRSLSLDIVCKEEVLLALLQLLPGLVELKMDLARPSSLGKHFFTGLLAKPGNHAAGIPKFDWKELFKENSTGWRCTICPSLRVLELKYRRWLRPGYNDDFLPPLLALSWTREKTATPLQLHVHYKSSTNSLESWNSSLPQVTEAISCLRLLQYGRVARLALQTRTWNNAVHENPHFAPFLYRLQVLEIMSLTGGQVLNVLPSIHELRELSLHNIDVQPLARDVDLPLAHTLQKLSLRNSTLTWMDGLVFTQLQKFAVDEHGWPETFKRKVRMPVCTHIVFCQYTLGSLPVLESDFHLPLLHTCELDSIWHLFTLDESGFSALQRIHAKRLKFRIVGPPPRLLELLEPKDEVEQLDLSISHDAVVAQAILAGISVISHITRKVPCPNMKVLRLQLHDIRSANREQVLQSSCMMMNKRRLAGSFLEKCYIWWHHDDWKKAAPFVLVMKNEGVIIEERSVYD